MTDDVQLPLDFGAMSLPPVVMEKLSRDAALTRRNRELLAAGRHPVTRAPLFIGTGEMCGDCVHSFVNVRAHRYWKCELNATHGAATDLRKRWPACALYQPRPPEEEP